MISCFADDGKSYGTAITNALLLSTSSNAATRRIFDGCFDSRNLSAAHALLRFRTIRACEKISQGEADLTSHEEESRMTHPEYEYI